MKKKHGKEMTDFRTMTAEESGNRRYEHEWARTDALVLRGKKYNIETLASQGKLKVKQSLQILSNQITVMLI